MYSWVRLVSPYTEELISRPFVDENRFRLVRQTRIGPENAIGCIVFPISLTFVFVSNSLVCSRGSRGALKWICSKTATMDLSPVQIGISFAFHVSCLISAIILKTINAMMVTMLSLLRKSNLPKLVFTGENCGGKEVMYRNISVLH